MNKVEILFIILLAYALWLFNKPKTMVCNLVSNNEQVCYITNPLGK